MERIDGLETERVIEWEIIINEQEEIEEDGLPSMKRATESNAERVEERENLKPESKMEIALRDKDI